MLSKAVRTMVESEAKKEAERRNEIAAMFGRVKPSAYLFRERWDKRSGFEYEK